MDHNRIELTRGDSLDIRIDLADEDGEPYELREGDELTLTVKRDTSSPRALITKHGQDVTFAPADTEGLDYGTYWYDVQLTSADGRVCTVVRPSEFRVLEEVTW